MQIGMDLVYAKNKIKHTALRVVISSAIGLVLSIILAPKFGAIGCAAATGLALVLTQILYIDYFQKKMELNMRFFFKNCHLKIMPLMAVYALIGYLICKLFIIDNWLFLFVVIAVYTLGYFVIAWFFLANQYEKELILGFVKKRKNG